MTFHLAVWEGKRTACDPTDRRHRARTLNPDAVTCMGCRRTNEFKAAVAVKRAEAAE